MGCGSSNATKVMNDTNGGIAGVDAAKDDAEESVENKNSVKYREFSVYLFRI